MSESSENSGGGVSIISIAMLVLALVAFTLTFLAYQATALS